MDKRLEKRHKRQVERAKKKVKVSEPDVRTPEQIEAAREISHAITTRGGTGPKVGAPASRGARNPATTTGSSPKTAS